MVVGAHSSTADAGWLAVAGRDADADVALAAPDTGVRSLDMESQTSRAFSSFLELNKNGDDIHTGVAGAGSAAAAGAVGAAVGVGLPSSSAAASGAVLAAAGTAETAKKKSKPFRIPKNR